MDQSTSLIYYDDWISKCHKMLVRVTPATDTTSEALKREVREFLRRLKTGVWV